MDAREIAAEIKAIEGDVKEAVADRGKMRLDNYTFECKTMPGRKTVDKDSLTAFLEQHGKSMADFEKVGAPFMTLRVDEADTIL
jgi:hypothetical protein|tara:strand:+ start:1596 stop:1847 length:252 start_codon:yes stop_codon:yes gene_type:complete